MKIALKFCHGKSKTKLASVWTFPWGIKDGWPCLAYSCLGWRGRGLGFALFGHYLAVTIWTK